MNYGEQVRYYRKKMKFNLQILSEKTGFSQSKLSRIENTYTKPDDEVLDVLCNVFDISLDEFLKKNRSQYEVVVTDNDLILFIYLLQNGFLDRSQIASFVYKNYNEFSVRNRLAQLTKQGYVKKIKSPLGKLNETVLVATRKTVDTLVIKHERLSGLQRTEKSQLFYVYPDEYTVSPFLDMRNLAHDNYLNNTRFILENNGANLWRSHRLLYKKGEGRIYDHNPDGTFIVKNRTFAVELENTLKKSSTYKDYLSYYAVEKKIDFILYVVTKSLITPLMKKITKDYIQDNFEEGCKKFWFISYDDLIKGKYLIQNPYFKEPLDLLSIMR